MKILLERQSINITLKTGDVLSIRGFYEQEPGFDDGFCIIDKQNLSVAYNKANITLTDLNLVMNDLSHRFYNLDYKTKGLERAQIEKIMGNLMGLVIDSIIQEFPSLTVKQANVIYGKAYEDGHSAGYSEVIIYCMDYIQFAMDLIESINIKETKK